MEEFFQIDFDDCCLSKTATTKFKIVLNLSKGKLVLV